MDDFELVAKKLFFINIKVTVKPLLPVNTAVKLNGNKPEKAKHNNKVKHPCIEKGMYINPNCFHFANQWIDLPCNIDPVVIDRPGSHLDFKIRTGGEKSEGFMRR